jgi:hypothetical protein
MKLLLENWRKHLKEGEEPVYDVGAQPGGKNKVYVLTRRDDNEIVEIVGVYSSEELAQKGIESDIKGWRAQSIYKWQVPSPEDYETEDFELDDRGNAAPAEEEAQLDDTGDGRIWSYIHGAAPSGDDDGFIPWDEAVKESGFTQQQLMDYIDNYASGSEQYYMKYNDDGLDLYDPASV